MGTLKCGSVSSSYAFLYIYLVRLVYTMVEINTNFTTNLLLYHDWNFVQASHFLPFTSIMEEYESLLPQLSNIFLSSGWFLYLCMFLAGTNVV